MISKFDYEKDGLRLTKNADDESKLFYEAVMMFKKHLIKKKKMTYLDIEEKVLKK